MKKAVEEGDLEKGDRDSGLYLGRFYPVNEQKETLVFDFRAEQPLSREHCSQRPSKKKKCRGRRLNAASRYLQRNIRE